MDDDLGINIDDLLRAIREAEVLSFFFPLIRKSLIIDTRVSSEEQPMVRLAPQAGSLEERYRSIRRMRPSFPRPDNVTAIPWPKYVQSLVDCGAIAALQRRLESLGDHAPIRSLKRALAELRRLEQQELALAIRGEEYHTLWPSKK